MKLYFFLINIIFINLSVCYADLEADLKIDTDKLEDLNQGSYQAVKYKCDWEIDAKSKDGNCLKRLDSDDIEFLDKIAMELSSNLDKALDGKVGVDSVVKSDRDQDLMKLDPEKRELAKQVLIHHEMEDFNRQKKDLMFSYLSLMFEGREQEAKNELGVFAAKYNYWIANGDPEQEKNLPNI